MWLLLVTELRHENPKAVDRLERAYDDAAGVTAEFNKNVLRVINRELGGHFDVDAFRHVVHYDEFVSTGGYESLRKAIAMDRGDVVSLVKDCVLRGRGGSSWTWRTCDFGQRDDWPA